ncbi:hypothetical protein HTZ97_11940 [Desulfuromonas acetoxidans]|uniref:Uncharacterized protein n=1 Tax=Desulfuromonas acetoxidans (strain DSM 684 / 11070) TaxID=281689 RepID=Q1JZE1_DESA6|nr:MXAN_5187 C-terminal domain-containing protein [Desulfuromonas acetoxidans]EAT15626.1 conserved hypothetical protein [Desulfuromonas acetoxidans DSM 684]MBF0645747.1 hypothetical protein [Desulfuromonas acetoxidans]NVD25219.1 hypothetical protein [Desulfuromonas acetoxidans]NVE17159.1 hypothetical protein [Desulfuromonas acetoxidans]
MAKVLDDRKQINQHLSDIELKLKDLRIRYEQYFAGVEKRAPVREREALERVIRRLNQRRIMQTDLRYRFQNLSGSFYSYQNMWDRIQREMDEGRYHRHKTSSIDSSAPQQREIDRVYHDYQAICRECQRNVPPKEQLESFIEKQKESIRQKYGNVECNFRVVNDQGKPKITVNLKR